MNRIVLLVLGFLVTLAMVAALWSLVKATQSVSPVVCASQHTLCGRVFSRSDVQSIGSGVLVGRLLFAIPAEHLPTVTGKPMPLTGSTLSAFPLERTVFEHYQIRNSLSAQDGYYGFSLTKGTYVVCLSNPASQGTQVVFPVLIVGCTDEITTTEIARVVDVSWGLGGFMRDK